MRIRFGDIGPSTIANQWYGIEMSQRHQSREFALKVLFELESSTARPIEAFNYRALEDKVSPSVASFAMQLVNGVLANHQKIDSIIRGASTNWKLEQMDKVDLVILRLAVYELVISRQVPLKVAINEAIELAKTFSGDASGAFVNGVLGHVAQVDQGEQEKTKEIIAPFLDWTGHGSPPKGYGVE